MNRILIIDDDKDLCILLKKSISLEQLEADYCHSGKDGLAALSKRDYQLVVLDVMMPGMDGFETMEQIRKNSSIPILMLTSKSDNYSKVHGLRSGADDYLTKPFDMTEFIARVLSLIRRYTRFNSGNEEHHQLNFQGLSIDLDRHTVSTAQETLLLPPKEFDILLFCAKHQGKILTKQQIYEAVWGEPYVYDDSNIMAIISRLRKKIEPDPAIPTYIQTVKGIGYQFNTEV
ncbi:MAG: response regulator transcription factor [Lachnospiraceae bacterium]|nr:response regulator transcription factor [Lachnospiraceae bacterium]